MKALNSTLLALAMLGTFSGAAVAEGKQKIPGACQADAAKFCPGMTPGDQKFGPCMRQHKAEVSEACKAVVKKHRDNHPGKPGLPGGPTPGANN